jgi:hypothetical protein
MKLLGSNHFMNECYHCPSTSPAPGLFFLPIRCLLAGDDRMVADVSCCAGISEEAPSQSRGSHQEQNSCVPYSPVVLDIPMGFTPALSCCPNILNMVWNLPLGHFGAVIVIRCPCPPGPSKSPRSGAYLYRLAFVDSQSSSNWNVPSFSLSPISSSSSPPQHV